ncbi:MAG: hypothetical protein Q7S60_02095 [bacterium]|nr:hypothetical protein [bacterium]
MREIFWKFDVGIKLVFLLVILFLATDRVVGGFSFLPSKTKTALQTEPVVIPQPVSTTTQVDVCGADCQNVVRNLVADAIATVSGQTTTIVKETSVVQQKKSSPRTSFIPLGGSASTISQSWVDVKGSDVYIDLSDYNGASSIWVGFDATIKMESGNGKAYARLFDVTHGIAVSGSEASTSSGDFTVASAENISLWAGNNLYRAQIKSLNGLTASFSSGRVKIVTK